MQPAELTYVLFCVMAQRQEPEGAEGGEAPPTAAGHTEEARHLCAGGCSPPRQPVPPALRPQLVRASAGIQIGIVNPYPRIETEATFRWGLWSAAAARNRTALSV